MRLSPLQRKDTAERLLVWLKENNITSCPKTYDILCQCSEAIDEPVFDLWKAYGLLRIMGRIELNCPNGKKGFRVLDYTSLAVYQLRSDGFKRKLQKDMLVRILSNMKKQYKDIWDDCMSEVK